MLNLKYSILRLPDVKASSGYSQSTIYNRIAEGLWTKPIKLGDKSSGWPAYEIELLNAARISNKNNEEIRDLVKQLEADRSCAMQNHHYYVHINN